jgi:hypothetical protein
MSHDLGRFPDQENKRMLGRALSLATVTLLIGGLATGAAHAQATNLEAGKSPSQIFAGTCTACHKSPRGLLKTVPASSLPGYLRQHYTTSSDMASVLSSYLVSNGATDTRYQAKDQPKQGKDAKPEAKQEAMPGEPPDQLDRVGRRRHPPAATQEAAKPDADGLTQQGEGAHPGQKGKRMARPAEPADAKPVDGQTRVPGATDAKQGARQKLGKRGKPVEDLSKPDTAKPDTAKPEEAAKVEPKEDASKPEAKSEAKPEAKSEAKSETNTEAAKTDAAKSETDKPESAAKPAPEGKSETAKVDAAKETTKETTKEGGGSEPTLLRPDPVPPVTPAPPAVAAAPSTPAPSAVAPPEPSAAAASPTPPAAPPAPAAVTASAPPAAPAPPAGQAGPPVPPISQ